MITCKNCGHQYKGKYCSNCAQPADTERITWKELIHHLPHAVFHVDGGLLYTIKEMIVRPGHTLRDYLNGKRVHHFNPFLFVLLLGGLLSALYLVSGTKPLNTEIDLHKLEEYSPRLAHKYFAVLGILTILLLTLTDYFFYRSHKYTVPELLLCNTFQAGQVITFLIIIFPLFLLQNHIRETYDVLIKVRPYIKVAIMVYFFIVRYQFYNAKGNYVLIGRITLQVGLLYVVYHYVIAQAIINWLS